MYKKTTSKKSFANFSEVEIVISILKEFRKTHATLKAHGDGKAVPST